MSNTETEVTSKIKTDSSEVMPTMETTVTSVTEKITVRKSASSKAGNPSKADLPGPVQEPEARPSGSLQKPSSSKTFSFSSKSSSKQNAFREYTDATRLLSDLSRDYRGTSPAVLENIATHSAIYSSKYMPDKFNPALSARSRKVIRDAEELAVVTPGLKNMLEVRYQCCVRAYA